MYFVILLFPHSGLLHIVGDQSDRLIIHAQFIGAVQERQAFIFGDPARGIPGAVQNGVSEQAAQKIYDEILDFANYAFNKAHAVCYAKVSYDTAYLKCHYPRQYMAALMTSVLDSAEKIAGYIGDCKDMGIALLPPDLNRSEDKFTVEEGGIRFGLAAVKNIGRGLIRRLVAERERGGPFRSLEDLCNRMQDTDLNKRAVENLIKCGAMDCLGLNRAQLLAIYAVVMDEAAGRSRRNLTGQMGLFDLFADQAEPEAASAPNIPELPIQERLMLEKETTGLYLSGHPMDQYRRQLKGLPILPIVQVVGEEATVKDEALVTVAGIIQSVKQKTTRNNSVMAYVTLEDDTAAVELLVFSNALSQCGAWLREGNALVAWGKVSIRDEKAPQIILNRGSSIEEYRSAAQRTTSEEPKPKCAKLYLRLPSEDSLEYKKSRAILNMFPGAVDTVLFFADTRVRRGTRCDPDPIMLQELKSLLGADSVVEK